MKHNNWPLQRLKAVLSDSSKPNKLAVSFSVNIFHLLFKCEVLTCLMDVDDFSFINYALPNTVWPETYNGYVLFVRARMRPCVCVSRNIVNTISCRVLDTFSPNLNQ